MQRRRLLWGILMGMVVVILVAVFWHRNREGARTRDPLHAANIEPRHEAVPELLQNQHAAPAPRGPSAEPAKPAKTNVSHNIPLLTYRLKNTEKELGSVREF